MSFVSRYLVGEYIISATKKLNNFGDDIKFLIFPIFFIALFVVIALLTTKIVHSEPM